MMSPNIDNIVFITAKGDDYCCIIYGALKSFVRILWIYIKKYLKKLILNTESTTIILIT